MGIYCASAECKYNSNTGRCTAKRVELSFHSVNTLWEGRQDFWKCKSYEMSEESKRIMDQFAKMMKEGEDS